MALRQILINTDVRHTDNMLHTKYVEIYTEGYVSGPQVYPPQHLFHGTPKRNLHKILRSGLYPHNSSFQKYDSPRIYFTNTIESAKSMAENVEELKEQEVDDYQVEEIVVVEIDTKNIRQIPFYQEYGEITEFGEGIKSYYTYYHIPASSIGSVYRN